jgi:hypothetical protein
MVKVKRDIDRAAIAGRNLDLLRRGVIGTLAGN